MAWRLSEESFLKDLNLFDDLKLRVGYGVSGNSLGFDVFTATQGLRCNFGLSTYTLRRNSAGTHSRPHPQCNPDLKWERTGMF